MLLLVKCYDNKMPGRPGPHLLVCSLDVGWSKKKEYFECKMVIPDDSLRHGEGRVSTDNDSISRVEDVCGNSLISEEGVTDQGITFGTGMSLEPQVADAGQIGLATLGSLAPE